MNWKDYQERREAQKYFRSHNDQFLSQSQWVKTILYGVLGAVVLGVLYSILNAAIYFGISFLYIVMGYAIANIVTSVSGVSSKQMGILSVCLTFLSYFISVYTGLIYVWGLPALLSFGFVRYAFTMLVSGNILSLCFIVVGLFVAYQQAQ